MTENKASFFARIEPLFAPSTVLKIKLAYMLAKHGHRAQFRKEKDEAGEHVRYFEHVRRVTLNLIDIGRFHDPIMIMASPLHDTVEDTEDVTIELIEMCFGQDVAGIVKVLSKTPPENYIDRFMACTDWRPYVIKACDRLDNLRSLGQTPREFQLRQLEETEQKYFPLFERMMTLCPDSAKPGADRLRMAIIREVGILRGSMQQVTSLS